VAIRLRTKKLIYSGLIGAGIMLIICGICGYFYYQYSQEKAIQLQQEYKSKVQELKDTIEQTEIAYALNVEVKPGDEILEDMLVEVYVPAAGAPEDKFMKQWVTKDGSSRRYFAKTNIKPNTILTKSMVYQDKPITRDVREAEYSFIELPTNLKVGDYIDIRIQFPTGDDFILLSKKEVKDLSGLTVWFDVDEGEILTMSSAVVDAYVSQAKIYAMPYVDKHMQDPSEMTYPVKENVKALIQESPNIVNIAKLNLTEQNRQRVEQNLANLDPAAIDRLRSGEKVTKNQVTEERERMTAEERVNAANEGLSQKEIINGGGEE